MEAAIKIAMAMALAADGGADVKPPSPAPACVCPDSCRCPGSKSGQCGCGAQRKSLACPDNDGGPCACGCRAKRATACRCGESSGRIDVPRLAGRVLSHPAIRTPPPAPTHWPRQAVPRLSPQNCPGGT